MTRIARFRARKKEALPPPPPPQAPAPGENTGEEDSESITWTKLALGDNSEAQVSPYQTEPQTGENTEDSPSEATGSDLDTEDPSSLNPSKISPETSSETEPETDADSVSSPSPAELDRQEKAAKKAAKKAEKVAKKQARLELEAQYATIPEARRVKLTLARINPLSAMKIGFLVAVAFAIVQLVAAIALWLVLDMLHVFSSMQGFLAALSATALVNLMDALQFSRAVSLVAIFGVFQIVIMTDLAWLAAVIYNLIARMVGGLHMVLTDE